MGFRYRKSLKIAPGLKVNIGKNGFTSVSIGKKGASVNINKKGTRSTIGIPGSGLSYSSYKPHSQNHNKVDNPPQRPSLLKILFTLVFIFFMGLIVIGLFSNKSDTSINKNINTQTSDDQGIANSQNPNDTLSIKTSIHQKTD